MSVNNVSSQGVSLSIASLRASGVVVMGFAEKVIVFHHDKPQEKIVVDDGQILRSVAVSQLSENGPLCVVTGGDGKRINVYNASTWGSPPVFSFGPHTKRITQVAIADDDTIIFADKFGEVYRLEISRDLFHDSPASRSAVKPTFLLQHFSVLTNFFLSSSVLDPATKTLKRWLFTCDRDRRTRVSCYPETYRIEQFLWTNSSQSVVTCITEIPMEKENRICFVIGCYDGKVHLWSVEQSAAAESQDPFTRVDTYIDASSECSPVVGIAHVAQGVLVAYSASQEVTFLPFCDGEPGFALEHIARVALESFPVAMAALHTDEALLLERSGRLAAVRSVGGKPQVEEYSQEPLRTAVRDVMNRTVEGGTMLSTMDLFAHWNHDAVDPRSRQRSRNEMEMGEVESNEDDVEATENNNNNDSDKKCEGEGKKHRMELSDESAAL